MRHVEAGSVADQDNRSPKIFVFSILSTMPVFPTLSNLLQKCKKVLFIALQLLVPICPKLATKVGNTVVSDDTSEEDSLEYQLEGYNLKRRKV